MILKHTKAVTKMELDGDDIIAVSVENLGSIKERVSLVFWTEAGPSEYKLTHSDAHFLANVILQSLRNFY